MLNYFVIFGGGGIRGVSYCGACKALFENDVNITGLAGSSIGAVFASFLSLGYEYDEIFELFCETGFGLFSDFNFDITKEIAFSKGQKFYDWMKHSIEKKFYQSNYKKGKMPPVKFCDIDKPLVIFAVDLSRMEFKEFSSVTTPDCEIAYAVRASVSMPGLFTPLITDDNSYLVDGDLLKSSPLWRMSNTIKSVKDRILEFRLEDTSVKSEIKNPIEYLNRVYNTICGFATQYIIDLYGCKDKFDYIKIETPDVSVVDFLISSQKKEELYNIGYSETNKYLNINLKKKHTDLLLKYKKLLDNLLVFQKNFEKCDYFESYICLCELFVYLCEEKRCIDSFIYEKICELKQIFFENYVRIKFFGFSKSKLKDKKDVIYNILLETIKILTLKVSDLN